MVAKAALVCVAAFLCAGCTVSRIGQPEPAIRSAEFTARNGAELLPSCDNVTADDIATHAQYLSGFNPIVGTPGTPPALGNMSSIRNDAQGPNIVKALTQALSLAPTKFLHRLCKDNTYLFVDKGNTLGSTFDGAYAFWQTKAEANGNPPIRFISLPLGLFTNPPTYDSYEEELLSSLIGVPTYQIKASSNYNNSATALLAVVAHEQGHIIAARHLGPKADTDTKCPAANVHFYDFTWLNPGNIPAFHQFNTDVYATHSTNDPYPSTIKDKLSHSGVSAANQELALLYSNTNFASLFAALAPDEDIAETYKYHVLRKALPRLILTLQLPGNGASILALNHLKSGINQKKENCVDNEDNGN